MKGKLFITRTGYDPERKYIKDPYLEGAVPSLGACRPDIRKAVKEGDHLFFVSGRVKGLEQFVMGGFEIDRKIDAREAFKLFPGQRLHTLTDGQLAGNVIIEADGHQHPLDNHPSAPEKFERRLENYVLGKNLISISEHEEIERGRNETMEVLQEVLGKTGTKPFDLLGRPGATLNEDQIHQLREWLQSLKAPRRKAA